MLLHCKQLEMPRLTVDLKLKVIRPYRDGFRLCDILMVAMLEQSGSYRNVS